MAKFFNVQSLRKTGATENARLKTGIIGTMLHRLENVGTSSYGKPNTCGTGIVALTSSFMFPAIKQWF